MLENLESVAFDLAVRSLGQQERVLEDLRARTGTLLTATAVTSSFLGARALTGNAEHTLGIIGFAFAIGSIVLSVYVLAPKGAFDFAISGAAIYEYFASEEVPVTEAKRIIAYWAQDAWNANQTVIDSLVSWFQQACAALVLAVGLWSLALALH